MYQILSDFENAEKIRFKSLIINEILGRKEDLANTYRHLGKMYHAQNDSKRVDEMFEKFFLLLTELKSHKAKKMFKIIEDLRLELTR